MVANAVIPPGDTVHLAPSGIRKNRTGNRKTLSVAESCAAAIDDDESPIRIERPGRAGNDLWRVYRFMERRGPFLLNLPVFSRDEEIEEADRLVGDFSSSVLISVEPGSAASVIEQARQLQTQLHCALAHTAWSGVDVLRDLSRQQQINASLAPVVFTSALALGDLFEPQVRAVLGEPVWSVSQGPQVLIDAQAIEYLNGIMLNWDVRTDRFAPGVIDAMFDGFQQQVHALLDDITYWLRPLPVPPAVAPWPPETVEPASAPTLLHRFFVQAEREPDAIALQWGSTACCITVNWRKTPCALRVFFRNRASTRATASRSV